MEIDSNNVSNVSSGAAANIHCKLTFNNQIRRFVFSSTEFADLRGQISQLIGLPPDGFVLKYVDNESDLITLSTNEELSLALILSDKVLRLVAEPVVAQQTEQTTSSNDYENPWSHFRGGAFHHHGGRRGGHRGGHHHGHHGGPHGYHGGHHQGGYHGGQNGGPPGQHGGPHQGGQHGSPQQGGQHGSPHQGGPHHGGRGRWEHHADKFEEQKMRITTKIEMMKNLLAKMPPEDQSPSKYKLMSQIHRLEGRLIRWDSWIEKKGKKADQKHCKKFEKHEKKQSKKLDHLSPEALQQFQLLKAQIASLKPTLYELKSAKKAKKSELEIALQQGSGDKEAIWQEILVLKERITEVKKEIKPLKDSIKALKEKK